MLPRNDPDRIQITFDDHRLVANAGLLLPVTAARAKRQSTRITALTLTPETRMYPSRPVEPPTAHPCAPGR